MTPALLAQGAFWGGAWGIAQFAVAAIVVIAIAAVVYALAQYCGFAIPPVVVRIFWICIIAAIAILAIRFLVSL